MKNRLYIFLIVLFFSCAAKSNESSTVVLYHKLNDKYTFKIEDVISDSRCPKNKNCVWEGQVELIISIYENENFLNNEILVLNAKNLEINKGILEKYTLNKKIISIQIHPEKNQENKMELNSYYLEIIVE